MTFIITLDAGHGEGRASNRGSLIGNEGDNNYAYSLVLKAELERYQGVKVLLTRAKSSDNPTLKQRGALAKGSDLLLSLHSNAYNGKAQGISIFDSVQKPNKVLANALLTSLSKFWKKRQVYYISLPNDSKRDYYGVLRDSGAKSSMMIEHGFHDYLPDVKIYVNKRKEIAQATVQVLAKHYGLTLKPLPSSKPLLEQPYEHKQVRVTKDTQLWAFDVKSWGEITAVKPMDKGTILDVGDVVTNALGSKYIRTNYSKTKGVYHGVNIVDTEPVIPKAEGITAPYGKIYRVVVGSYKERANAEKIQSILKEKGFNAFLSLVDYKEPMKK